jgi:hypothetical protein
MIVRVINGQGVEVGEVADFTGFKVDAGGATAEEVATALLGSAAGNVEDEHAFICAHFLRLSAGDAARTPEWSNSFNGMLRYAQSKGWLSADQHFIRGHIENLAPETP